MDIIPTLHPITWCALVSLSFVLFLYYRQYLERKRQLREQLRPQNPYYLNTPQGHIQEPQTYTNYGSNLPTFSPQELEQRKTTKDVNSFNMNPRNLQSNPEFGNNSIPPFNSIYMGKERTIESPDKMFESAKRNTSYEATKRPVEPTPAFGIQARPVQDNKYTPSFQPILGEDITSTSEVPKNPIVPTNAPLNLTGPNPQPTSVTSTIQVTKEEVQPGGNRSNIQTFEQTTAQKYSSDTEHEYKVFKETFKQREGSTFREEARKFESPQRMLERGNAALIRVGHSPDSPFKIFASPNTGSKNKSIDKEEDYNLKVQKPRGQTLASKKDSFTRAQEALDHAPKARGSVQTGSSRSTKLSSVQKSERKTRTGQIFIDNNSEDEMPIEEETQAANTNKRTSHSSYSIDNLEKESSKKKFMKNNAFQAKERVQIGRKPTKDVAETSNTINKGPGAAKQPVKKDSTVGISYLSAYGSNASMRKYVEKKAAAGDNTRTTKSLNTTVQPKSPITTMSMTTSQTFIKTQDKPKVEPPKTFSSLIQPTAPTTIPKNTTTNGSFLPTSQPKPSTQEPVFQQKPSTFEKTNTTMVSEDKPAPAPAPTGFLANFAKQPEKMPEEKKPEEIKKEEKPVEKPVEPKPEGTKMSSILGGSSLFSQKPAETNSSVFGGSLLKLTPLSQTPSLTQPTDQSKPSFTEKQESPKKETSEKEALPKTSFTQPSGGDIFKTIRPGGAPTKPDESKDKPKTFELQTNKPFAFGIPKEEKKDEPVKADQPQSAPSTGLSLNLFGNNGEKKVKEATSDDKEKEQKQEPKGLFASSGVTNFSGTGGLFANFTSKSATTTTSDANKASSNATQSPPKTEIPANNFLGQLKTPALGVISGQSPLFAPKTSDKEEPKTTPSLQKPPSFSEVASLSKTNSSPPKDDKSPKGGLFSQLNKDGKPLFSGSATEEKKDSTQPSTGLGLFSGLGGGAPMFKNTGASQQSDGATKKMDTPSFGAVKPAGDADNKPNLFGNNAGGGLFGNSSQTNTVGGGSLSLGSGALFGGTSGNNSILGGAALSGGLFGSRDNKAAPSGGGLFANLNSANNNNTKNGDDQKK